MTDTVLTSERVEVALDTVGPGSRAAAYFIDSAIRFSILFSLGFLLIALLGQGWFPARSGVAWALLVLAILAFEWGYHVLFEWRWRGATPGKRLLGIRVVRADARPIGLAEAAARNLLRAVDVLPFGYGLGALFLLFDRRGRRIGDLAAGTVVVREEAWDPSVAREVLEAREVRAWATEPLEWAEAGLLAAREVEILLDAISRGAALPEAARSKLLATLSARAAARRARGAREIDPRRFAARRISEWEALSIETERLGRTDAPVARAEILRAASGFRRVAADLSYAQRALAGTRLLASLNRLLLQAHHRFSAPAPPRPGAWRAAFLEELPRLVAVHGGAIRLATALFLAGALFGGAWILHDETYAAALLPPETIEKVRSGSVWTDRIFGVVPAASLSAGVARNNITVAFTAFALGATAGLGTAWILLFNGFLLGLVFAFTHLHGVADNLGRFVLAHGVVEIPVIVLAGAAGLRIGGAILAPGGIPRGEAFARAGREGALLAGGSALYLLPAGFIEGYISPAPLPWWLRLPIAAAFLAVFVFHLSGRAGRIFRPS